MRKDQWEAGASTSQLPSTAATRCSPRAPITAAAIRRTGDLLARVPEEGPDTDEFVMLSRAFNRMTAQLDSQRRELIQANQQLDERSRFTETVLAGVSAGVIGIDAEHAAIRVALRLVQRRMPRRVRRGLGRLAVEHRVQPVQMSHPPEGTRNAPPPHRRKGC